jgi:hypothetical protein
VVAGRGAHDPARGPLQPRQVREPLPGALDQPVDRALHDCAEARVLFPQQRGVGLQRGDAAAEPLDLLRQGVTLALDVPKIGAEPERERVLQLEIGAKRGQLVLTRPGRGGASRGVGIRDGTKLPHRRGVARRAGRHVGRW